MIGNPFIVPAAKCVVVFCISDILINKNAVCHVETQTRALYVPESHLCFALISALFFSHPLKVPAVFRCFSVRRPDAELHGAAEKAFVTLNPCHVSVDDIIV